ncbi:MAG: ankyrin repeat domain-containing protein [Verrucomicrobiota bacterium]|nr:ankyrin repeat domain-containing protein [Verrucomicrobiota bacterium]
MHASLVRILICGIFAFILAGPTNVTPDQEVPRSIPAQPATVKSETFAPSPVPNALPVLTAGRTNIVDRCFTSELDRNAPATADEMALVAAAIKEDWEGVRRMLEAGASVEIANDSGVTPLMAAAMQGNVDIIRVLIQRRARVDSLDSLGRSALHYALAAGKLEAIQLLLLLTPNLETASATGQELLTLALGTGNMQIFQAVLQRLPATLAWTPSTRRALEAALNADMKEQVRLLLSKHPAPPTREGGIVPLIAYAMASDNAPLFHTLLACGSDPNIVIPKAAEKEFMALIKSKYLRLYIQEETGINLLMLAAGLGKDDYVRALLDAGADRNRSTPREKMLPLYFAAWTENWQCVQLLLGGGPMPDQLRVEISLAKQSAMVIKDGVTIFTTKVSTGRQGFGTKPGQYVITDKDRDHRSTIYKCAMPYFMRLNCRDFGMHEGVVQPYPASHGCIRLPGDAAKKLFVEIPVGTVVMIN